MKVAVILMLARITRQRVEIDPYRSVQYELQLPGERRTVAHLEACRKATEVQILGGPLVIP